MSILLLPGLSVSSFITQAANYVRTELPVRIAHRLRDMQALPYIVVTQEEVAHVYEVGLIFTVVSYRVLTLSFELYWKAFDKYVRVIL